MPNRRKVLWGLGGSAILATAYAHRHYFEFVKSFFPRASKTQEGRYLLSGHTDFLGSLATGQKHFSKDVSGYLMVYDVWEQKLHQTPIAMHVHHFFPSPARPHLVAGCARWANGALLFDLQTSKTVQLFSPPKDHRFFGHGVFSADGERVFFAANNNSDTKGCFLVYESDSGKFLERLPSHGIYPHQCFWQQQDRLLTVANFESSYQEKNISNVTTIDISTGQVHQRLELAYATHMIPINERQVAVGSRNTSNGRATWKIADMSRRKVQANFMDVFQADFDLLDEVLSLAPYNDHIVLGTNNMGRLLLAWDWRRQKFAYHLMPGRTLGVDVIGDDIFVTVGLKGSLMSAKFDENQFKFVDVTQLAERFSNGSHLSRIKDFT